VNGGFESSLTGWSVFPLTGVNPIRASAETAGFGITPTEGRFQGDPGYTTSPSFDDFAVLIADGAAHILADVNQAGFFTSGALLRSGSSVTGVTKETGYLPLSYSFQNAGLQTIVFAVFNVSDISNQSALAIDDISVNRVPVPAAGGLLVLGVAGLAALRLRRR
jgi:hypothetical protein